MKAVWKASRIIETVSREIQRAGILLPEDAVRLLRQAAADVKGTDSAGEYVLQAIMETVVIAKQQHLPMCQDTGLAVIFADVGCDGVFEQQLETTMNEAVRRAYQEGNFRPSVVSDPVFERRNTGSNLPPVLHCRFVPGDKLRISGLLKGFGSENCSRLAMLNPTDGADAVVQTVVDAVREAGGKPCPPVFLGVGIGGSADEAGVLAKRALLREAGSAHREKRYADLEKRILNEVNALGIGPGGLGGSPTALAASIEHRPTHIAGLPVAVNISCWADRKFSVEIEPDVQ